LLQVVTSSTSPEERLRITEELSLERVIAIDCEAINLSRQGILSIVQIASQGSCYLFDVLNEENTIEDQLSLFAIIKRIFENEDIEKVIHDCRMDADALYHQYGIELKNVHDTQAWDMMIRRVGEKSMNDTLCAYDCEPNESHDPTVYSSNHAFWSTRPLTPKMLAMASGDVNQLLSLRIAQIRQLESQEDMLIKCQEASLSYSICYRHYVSKVSWAGYFVEILTSTRKLRYLCVMLDVSLDQKGNILSI
jgi:ribonuclease D